MIRINVRRIPIRYVYFAPEITSRQQIELFYHMRRMQSRTGSNVRVRMPNLYGAMGWRWGNGPLEFGLWADIQVEPARIPVPDHGHPLPVPQPTPVGPRTAGRVRPGRRIARRVRCRSPPRRTARRV